MMKTTLGDLNEYLFKQLDSLSNEDLTNEELEKEIKRSKAVGNIANTIVSNGNLVLNAQKFMDNKLNTEAKIPKMLEGDNAKTK